MIVTLSKEQILHTSGLMSNRILNRLLSISNLQLGGYFAHNKYTYVFFFTASDLFDQMVFSGNRRRFLTVGFMWSHKI